MADLLDDPDLEDDICAALQRNSEHGAWIDSARIGLEVGFDRADAGRKVRPFLKRLAERGLIEEQRELNQPIIYRWKAWQTTPAR
jgi:hypothetical protein